MHGATRWLVRRLVVPAAVAALAVGLIPAGADAGAATAPRIDGGVEDGTFSPTCLGGSSAPDTGVLNAAAYRDKLGEVIRILVPWNIATNAVPAQWTCLQSYLADAHADGIFVEVSLNRVTPNSDGPSVDSYTTAVDDLARAEQANIRYLTAWNEPNNPAYLANPGAAGLAAKYFKIARAAFPGKMIGGDFASGVGPTFLSQYVSGIGSASLPSIWSIHPYTDVLNFENDMQSGDSAAAAGAAVLSNSKVVQYANELHNDGVPSSDRIWIGEIYVYNSNNTSGTNPFSNDIRADAALFVSDGMEADTLPGGLAGKNVPQVTRYIYLRADDASSDQQYPEAHVLQVNFPDCVWHTLAGTKNAPAPQC